MNMKFKAEGFDEYIKQLDKIGKKAEGQIKRAVYDGAKVYGEACISAINALPTHEDGHYMTGGVSITGVTAKQKQGLIEGFGFAKMENKGGFWHTKAGFDGYNSVKTKRFPNGQPNALIANAVNSGTSRRPKTNFVGNAIRASQSGVIFAMSARFDADMENLIKE